MTAHGDAHNANVWFERQEGRASLSFFDPAFAGEHMPTLLAEVKTTFHNILAHPYWLYDPALAEQKFNATAKYENGRLFAGFDWTLSPVRAALLETKAEAVMEAVACSPQAAGHASLRLARGSSDSGLFLCPTLVMNLRAGATSHNPTSSLIGLSVAVLKARA